MQCRTIWPPVVDSESRAQSQNEWIEVLCLCFGIVYGIPLDQNIKVFDPSHYTVSQLRQGYYCIQSIPCVRKVLLGLSLFMDLHPLLPTQTIRDSFYGHTIYIIIYSNRFFLLTKSLCKVRVKAFSNQFYANVSSKVGNNFLRFLCLFYGDPQQGLYFYLYDNLCQVFFCSMFLL